MANSFLTWLLADALVVPIVIIGTFVLIKYVPSRQRFDIYSRILMAGLTSLLLAKLAASVWQPEGARPFIEMGVTAGAAYLNNPGFPSDHVLFTMSLSLAVVMMTNKKKIGYILLAMTLLVAVGRILALVHTPIDVVGGFIFALLGGVWYVNRPNKH